MHANHSIFCTASVAYPDGASKYSVPLMMTKCAGVLTPQANVEVATSTCQMQSSHMAAACNANLINPYAALSHLSAKFSQSCAIGRGSKTKICHTAALYAEVE